MKTILELREEAIKEDKNPEFYLYQKLVEVIRELHRKDNIINELKKYLEVYNKNEIIKLVLDKIKELENANK